MLQLDQLQPAGKKKKRIGRGGSRGGTSGRGHKGQGSRSGGSVRPTFEGGQMPLIRRIPKRGFNNVRFARPCAIVNIRDLEMAFEDGATIDRKLLCEKGLIKSGKSTRLARIKILGMGQLSKKFTVHADAVSASALKALQERGGTVTLSGGKEDS